MEHADGRRPPERTGHWIEREGWPCAEVVRCVGQQRIDDGRAALAAARKKKKGAGRPGVEHVDVLLTGPPRFTDPVAWTIEQIRDWADAGVRAVAELAAPPPSRKKWFRGRDPLDRMTILYAHVHYWEGAPHLHLAFVPVTGPPPPPEPGKLAPPPPRSWTKVQSWMAERGAGREIESRRAQMAEIQTALWREAGEPYGLERGKPSDAQHEAPDHGIQMADRVRTAERRTAEAEAERDAERGRRERAEGDRDADRRRMALMQEDLDRKRDRDREIERDWERADRRRERELPPDPGPPEPEPAPAFPPPPLPIPPDPPEPKPDPTVDPLVKEPPVFGQGQRAGGDRPYEKGRKQQR